METGKEAVKRILSNIEKMEKIKGLIIYLEKGANTTLIKKETKFIFGLRHQKELVIDEDMEIVLINVLKGIVDAMKKGLDEENKDFVEIAKGIHNNTIKTGCESELF